MYRGQRVLLDSLYIVKLRIVEDDTAAELHNSLELLLFGKVGLQAQERSGVNHERQGLGLTLQVATLKDGLDSQLRHFPPATCIVMG